MAVTEGQIRNAVREELYYNRHIERLILTKLTEWSIREFDLCDKSPFAQPSCAGDCDGCVNAAKLVFEVVTVYRLLMEGKLTEAKDAQENV